MAALHKYMSTLKKTPITPGSYVALWVPVITAQISETDRSILGGHTPAPEHKVCAPTLLYTPDGTTLQNRTTGEAYGTLTQYREDGVYKWRYTSNTTTSKYAPGYILRLWVIDPMPEADALAVARADYDEETARKRFEDYRAGSDFRALHHLSGVKDQGVDLFTGEAVSKLFHDTHQHHVYGADASAAFAVYEQMMSSTMKALDARLSEEFDRASQAIEKVAPLGDSSYGVALSNLNYCGAVSAAVLPEAPGIHRYMSNRPDGTPLQILTRGYDEARQAAQKAAERVALSASKYLAPAPTIG